MEEQKPGLCLVRNQDFAKWKEVEPKVKKVFQKCLNWDTHLAN